MRTLQARDHGVRLPSPAGPPRIAHLRAPGFVQSRVFLAVLHLARAEGGIRINRGSVDMLLAITESADRATSPAMSEVQWPNTVILWLSWLTDGAKAPCQLPQPVRNPFEGMAL